MTQVPDDEDVVDMDELTQQEVEDTTEEVKQDVIKEEEEPANPSIEDLVK